MEDIFIHISSFKHLKCKVHYRINEKKTRINLKIKQANNKTANKLKLWQKEENNNIQYKHIQ